MSIQKKRSLCLVAWLSLGLALVSCGVGKTDKAVTSHAEQAPAEKHGDEKEGGDEHEEHGAQAGASYEEGKGISLSNETSRALDLELTEVAEQDLEPTIRLTAQVYRTAAEDSRTYGKERRGNAYATALVSKDVMDRMASGQKVTFLTKEKKGENGPSHDGSVLRIETAQLPILGKGEVLLELPDSQQSLHVGAFVEARVLLGTEPRKVMGIPISAVLETSTGFYAFVQNGRYFLRTEIKTGARNEEYVEITEGLYEGDTIALKPVEALYLIELRATKGGGHSH